MQFAWDDTCNMLEPCRLGSFAVTMSPGPTRRITIGLLGPVTRGRQLRAQLSWFRRGLHTSWGLYWKGSRRAGRMGARVNLGGFLEALKYPQSVRGCILEYPCYVEVWSAVRAF